MSQKPNVQVLDPDKEELMTCQMAITHVLEYEVVVPKGKTLKERVNNVTRNSACTSSEMSRYAEDCVSVGVKTGVRLVKSRVTTSFPNAET